MPASDQGPLTGRYTLIARTLIFLTRGGDVLLIKGAADKRLWAGLYNGIGGHIERGEDVLSAAHRELKEETGLHAPNLWLCGVILIDTGEPVGIGIYVLRGEHHHGELQASKEGQLQWIPQSQLETLPLVEDLPILLPRVLSRQPGQPPFSGLYWYDDGGRLQYHFFEPKM
jgi:8-oxo-dGTP diphosphatase